LLLLIGVGFLAAALGVGMYILTLPGEGNILEGIAERVEAAGPRTSLTLLTSIMTGAALLPALFSILYSFLLSSSERVRSRASSSRSSLDARASEAKQALTIAIERASNQAAELTAELHSNLQAPLAIVAEIENELRDRKAVLDELTQEIHEAESRAREAQTIAKLNEDAVSAIMSRHERHTEEILRKNARSGLTANVVIGIIMMIIGVMIGPYILAFMNVLGWI
jgi:hypothetical protein